MLKTIFGGLSANVHQKAINFEYNIEYGPYLHNNPIEDSEPFYQYHIQLTKKYLTASSQVLDIGCGLGRIAIEMAKLGAGVTGLDKRDYMIYEANAIFGNHRNHILSYKGKGECVFVTGDALQLPFDEGVFNFITCINLIDRVRDPQQLIREIYRVVRSGGTVLLSDPYDWNDDITPRSKQVENFKQLIDLKQWSVVYEKDNIPYILFINNRRKTYYRSHVLILKKRVHTLLDAEKGKA